MKAHRHAEEKPNELTTASIDDHENE